MLTNTNLSIAKFEPVKIPGLQAWWDFSDLSTITKDGSNRVSSVKDKSGNSITINQGTAANQPLWVSSVQNGLDVLRFSDARIDYMTSASFFPTDLHDLYVVCQANDPGTFRDLIGTGTTTLNTGNLLLMACTNSSVPRAHYWGTSLTLVNSSSADTNLWTFINQGLDTATLHIRRYGVADTSTALVGTKSGGTKPLYIGFRGVSSAYFDGDMGEILAFDEYLSAANRTLIENYLVAKWGL